MGSLKSNYHTHNRLCNHAVGNAFDYVEKAIEYKYEEIGLTDHDPIPESFMTEEEYLANLCQRNMKEEEFYNIYLPEVKACRDKYKDKISIKIGLECEYLDEHKSYYEKLRRELDYLNLGVHFFKDKEGHIKSSYHDISYKNIDEYADACVLGMKTGLFKILVHPDLFMFDYKDINGKRIFDEACQKASKKIIEAAIKYDIVLEVNVNGLANSRKYNSESWLYPDACFWDIASTYKDLKIVIGIDAHNPLSLNSTDIDQVKEFCAKHNLNVLERLSF
ncbi:MAG: histidinol-phosphatase [Acholeplasmatales bacterium]|nr:histidinol-phosphatase [Acholeplasmatales bacterium]